MRGIIYLLSLAALLNSTLSLSAQNYKWYVLQSVAPLNETEVKDLIYEIKSYIPQADVWFNDPSSSTLGCRHLESIDWPAILENLSADGYYLGDITNGELHLHGPEAITSIYYKRACYYYLHPEARPNGYRAKLNQEEWDALPEDVREHYQTKQTYTIVNL